MFYSAVHSTRRGNKKNTHTHIICIMNTARTHREPSMRERDLREFSGRKCRYTQRGILGTCSAHDNVDEKQFALGGDTQCDQAPF